MEKREFGRTQDGHAVDLYVLKNKAGFEAAITNYGGTIVSLKAPDRNGTIEDVVLGYDALHGYEAEQKYFGATIGRYGNRIANGKFILAGKEYVLARNDGENSLHGGAHGFHKRVWAATSVASDAGEALAMAYLSEDGEEGYPGNLSVRVLFTLLGDRNALRIDYSAVTDKPTVLSLTNHSYFNLGGHGGGEILGHALTLYAGKFLPVTAQLIPSGELRSVANTPFDFLATTPIGARINQRDEQLEFGKGYDHNWVLDRWSANSLSPAAEVYDPRSGRVLNISTTEPGIQFYSGNFLDGTVRGKDGNAYPCRTGFCLETQHFPDSPNHAEFPTTVLLPGEIYRSSTEYAFSARK